MSSLEISYTLDFWDDKIVWDVRYRVDHEGPWRLEVMDICRRPQGEGCEVPWGEIAITSLVERAVESRYGVQLTLFD